MSHLTRKERKAAKSLSGILDLNYDSILGAVQDVVRADYVELEAKRNPGAYAFLDEDAIIIWNEAVRIAFDQWLEKAGGTT